MTDHRHARAKEIFLAAREHPDGERSDYVARACGTDDELLQEVESLLAYAGESETLPDTVTAPDYLDRLTAAVADRYEIEHRIGLGGMATVYLARDLKHDRPIAVKVLLPHVAATIGPARFLREVTLAANFNHPHILPLLDSGEAQGVLYYVMPFAEGRSLRERLEREKQLPIEDAVSITSAVARALDYAHRRGVIHRDIKPENILLHEGQPVVADFGIALALSASERSRLTGAGGSPGTPSYMSPEQVTGDRELDGRSDVYSLGCVAYEMLVGEPPHTGASLQSVLPKVVGDQPRSILASRRTVPPHVAAAVHTALATLPADRFSSAADFAAALANPTFRASGSAIPSLVAPAWWRQRATLVLAAVLAVFAAWGWLRPVPPTPVARYLMTLPYTGRLDLSGGGSAITISPDGSRLVYVGPGTRLWIRDREHLDPRPIPGTERGTTPFFSPDGASVAFYYPSFGNQSRATLNVLSLEGGPPFTVADSGVGATGGSWGADGYIYMDAFSSELVRVPEDGGALELLTTLDTAQGERAHRWPEVLPNKRGVLMTVLRGSGPEEYDVAVLDLRTGRHRPLMRGVLGKYAESGHLLLVAADGTLMAAPFDQNLLALTGPAKALAEGVTAPISSVALSESGRLLYVTAGAWAGPDELVWVARDGTEVPIDSDWTGDFQSLSISPDGTALAVTVDEPDAQHLWIKQLNDGPQSRLTLDGTVNRRPSWSPDGRSVLFVSDLGGAGTRGLYMKGADGSAAAELVLDRDRVLSEGLFSSDGEWLLFREGQISGIRDNLDILAVRPGVGGDPIEVASTAFQERAPALSPDGRWLAYVSTREGRPEVYVQPFPDAGDAVWRVSREGGQEPVWAHSGRELFYRNGWNDMVSVEVETAPVFSVGKQTKLFASGDYLANSYYVGYDVTPDDQRFAMIRYGKWQPGDLVVVENLFEELKVQVPR